MSSTLIEIVPYQARWPAEFRAVGARLRAALGATARRIDHIGSTSVPGLVAKDVLDIQIAVAALDPIEPLITAMSAAGGYRLRADVVEDHRPPGDAHAAAHWQKRYFRESVGGRPTHIHIRVDGHANERYALLFRDFLRASPLAAGAYAAVKHALAAQHPHDAEAYYAVKDPACDLIMAGAEVWAAASGWAPGPSDA